MQTKSTKTKDWVLKEISTSLEISPIHPTTWVMNKTKNGGQSLLRLAI